MHADGALHAKKEWGWEEERTGNRGVSGASFPSRVNYHTYLPHFASFLPTLLSCLPCFLPCLVTFPLTSRSYIPNVNLRLNPRGFPPLIILYFANSNFIAYGRQLVFRICLHCATRPGLALCFIPDSAYWTFDLLATKVSRPRAWNSSKKGFVPFWI